MAKAKKKATKQIKPLNRPVLAKKKIVKKVIKKASSLRDVSVRLRSKLPHKKKPVRKAMASVKIKPKKIAKSVVKKVLPKQQIAEFPAEALFKARIKVIGIGGGGGSIVSEIGRSLEKANFVIADTDIRALKKKSGIKYFWFGEEFTHGLGTGVNVDLAKQAAEGAKEKISQNFKDQDIIIFIASLGGGLGSGATQVFAEAAREFGACTSPAIGG